MRLGQFCLWLGAALVVAQPAAADTAAFAGAWQTAITCEGSRGGRFYVQHFVSTVINGVLHGLYGSAGEPSSLQIDGRVAPDGSARLHALGRTGDTAYTGVPPGTPYTYDIDAHFAGSSGSGTRLGSGRACKLQFER